MNYQVLPASIIRRLYLQREPLIQLARRQVQLSYKGSYLGAVWVILDPLLMMSLYAVVFGLFLGARFSIGQQESGFEFALALFLGLTIFNIVSETLSKSPASISSVPNYVKSIVFPVEVLPLAQVCATGWNFCVGIVLLCLGMLWVGVPFHWSGLWLPLIVCPIFLLAIGLGWALAALGVFLRDIGKLMRVVSMCLLYGSAIFFSPALIEQKSQAVWAVAQWNPILQAIDMARKSMLWGYPIDLWMLGYLYVVGLVMFVLGFVLFVKLRPAFSDVL